MKRVRPLNHKGTALIFAYFAISILLILIGTITCRAVSELNNSRRHMAFIEALYLGEGAIESVVYNLAYAVVNHQTEPVASTPTDISILSFPPSIGFLPSGFSATYTCEAIDSDQTITNAIGIATIVKNYRVTATASTSEFLSSGNPLSVSVNQIIARKKTYTFQHAVFYADDLEILPGPNMILSGKVHSNSDIYLGANNALTIDSEYLYSAGDIYNCRKDRVAIPSGGISIKVKDGATYELMKKSGEPNPLDSLRSDWTSESQTRWNGTVKSSVHGVNALAVPEVGSIQPNGYYAGTADITIDNGVLRKNGFVLADGVDVPAGTIQTTTTMYNNREGKTIRMTEIDMKKLAGYDVGDPPGSPSFPNNLPEDLGAGEGGLIYATRDDAGVNEQNGVRLKSGEEIFNRPKGVTVVSNLPVYVQGDYNRYNQKPASVICDAVNVLSNSWNDGTGYAVPSDTYIYAAFISGVDTTTSGDYNGGLENYPRMHENWSNSPRKTLYIRGSFVELWNSVFAQGEWIYGGPYYTAPTRDWDYDPSYNNINNLPPYTPFAVEMARVAWWRN
ncbi:hypothetical protein ACFL96_07315 [Thermoproteota archaeon]